MRKALSTLRQEMAEKAMADKARDVSGWNVISAKLKSEKSEVESELERLKGTARDASIAKSEVLFCSPLDTHKRARV